MDLIILSTVVLKVAKSESKPSGADKVQNALYKNLKIKKFENLSDLLGIFINDDI